MLLQVESTPLITPQSKAMVLTICGNPSIMALQAFRMSVASQPADYRDSESEREIRVQVFLSTQNETNHFQ